MILDASKSAPDDPSRKSRIGQAARFEAQNPPIQSRLEYQLVTLRLRRLGNGVSA